MTVASLRSPTRVFDIVNFVATEDNGETHTAINDRFNELSGIQVGNQRFLIDSRTVENKWLTRIKAANNKILNRDSSGNLTSLSLVFFDETGHNRVVNQTLNRANNELETVVWSGGWLGTHHLVRTIVRTGTSPDRQINNVLLQIDVTPIVQVFDRALGTVTVTGTAVATFTTNQTASNGTVSSPTATGFTGDNTTGEIIYTP